MGSEQSDSLAEGPRVLDGAVAQEVHDPGVRPNFRLPLIQLPVQERGRRDAKPRGDLLLLQFEIQPPRSDVIAKGDQFLWITRWFWSKCLKNKGWQHSHETMLLSHYGQL